jgi:CRP-like cAMP-binding protein
MNPPSDRIPKNRLLAALPPADYKRLRPHLEVRKMAIKDRLYDSEQPIEHIYFPTAGVASLMAIMEDGTLVEVGTIGNEGMVGIPVFLGTSQTSGMAFWQVPGEAVVMSSEVLRAEIERNSPLVSILQHYLQAVFVMLAQHTGCNRIHPIQKRCARWLLMTHDRVEGDVFPLTHEFLGQMLGVRRASVTEVMQELQNQGLIQYRRGIVTVVDRAGLEGAACECYQVIKYSYDHMLDHLRSV